MARTYWIDLFTLETWKEFQDHGSDVSGFSEKRRTTVQKIKPGDYLLCYLTRVSRWVGLLEVVGEPYFDEQPIWSSQTYPSRVSVRVLLALPPEQGVPVLDMRDELTVFRDLGNPNKWQGPFRGSPTKWKTIDGEAVVRALEDAKAHPVERPLGRLGKSSGPAVADVGSDDGTVIVPEDDESEVTVETEATGTVHTEVQYLLAKLGADMGFDTHVASNDQSRVWNGHRLGDMPRRRKSLPQQFDPVTNRTIELIDLLWLEGNAIVAAFEIESTTSIYSGLLRMSDLLARQPNISVPLFLVAPDERREQVVRQVNRPTFERMKPPLVEVCRYISFEGLREALTAAHDYVSFLKPDWLQAVSESCALEEL
jgi:predicted RNA-binding protein